MAARASPWPYWQSSLSLGCSCHGNGYRGARPRVRVRLVLCGCGANRLPPLHQSPLDPVVTAGCLLATLMMRKRGIDVSTTGKNRRGPLYLSAGGFDHSAAHGRRGSPAGILVGLMRAARNRLTRRPPGPATRVATRGVFE